MRLSLFEPLANTIESMPARAILRTLELESQMLKEDLAKERPLPAREVESLLSFYNFVKAVKEQSPVAVQSKQLPSHHLSFYKKTIERLVTAEELPAEARVQFETSFFKTPKGPAPGVGE